MASTKALLGLGGASAVGAGSLGGYLYSSSTEPNKDTFRSRYSLALIQDSEDTIWSKKLTALSTGSPKNKGLIDAKSKNTSDSLKKACKGIYDSHFSQDLMDDFKNFCSKHYADQFSNKQTIAADTDLNGKWETFKGKTSSDLSGELLKIHESKKDSSSEPDGWKKLVFDECKKLSTSIFEGEIKGYQEFCTKQ
ncbi:hypothetical protein HF1_10050 [Mycoplasma haemofelis str. Langford 1]|uniref:Uncharacterized protein n=2 Tax=Mycoplasma haemofelis TaxID=29501 RepID=F6FJI7_MYCHI|nr:hypothetical protein [Mycoplasma haemofelis]AEG73342.1 hypothetical protein MHF_1094 [Mycoplasma haemofelis Ohio2]CBY93013.1 hypothetical protein HF1_10050 [Mycoplasma haemofelis str. Langford 1]